MSDIIDLDEYKKKKRDLVLSYSLKDLILDPKKKQEYDKYWNFEYIDDEVYIPYLPKPTESVKKKNQECLNLLRKARRG